MDVITRNIKCSSDTKCLSCEYSPCCYYFWKCHCDSCEESLEEMLMCLKVCTNSPRSSRSDVLHRFKCLYTELKIEYIFDALKQWREKFGCTLTDSRYTQCSDKSINRERAFCLDGSHEIIDRFFFVSLYL